MAKKKQKRSKIDSWGSKPYIITVLVFLAWMIFLDKHSVIKQVKVSRTLAAIETEIEDYKVKYEEALEEKKIFEENKEKFAREEYNFSEEGEQIFIIK